MSSKLFAISSTPFPKTARKVRAWTDGSCSTYHCRSGGWAFHVRFEDRILEGVGAERGTTVNAMELMALIKLLERLKPHPTPLEIRSDSQYVVDAMTKHVFNWISCGFISALGQPIKNEYLIRQAYALLEAHRVQRPVALLWIRGHNGDGGNERCDELAGAARKALVAVVKNLQTIAIEPTQYPEPNYDSHARQPLVANHSLPSGEVSGEAEMALRASRPKQNKGKRVDAVRSRQ